MKNLFDLKKFNTNSFEIFDDKWALVTAGEKDGFNTMTINWGGLGTLWEMPVVTVYVKPVRYTHQFMERSDYFTVGFYTEDYRGRFCCWAPVPAGMATKWPLPG